MMEMLNVGLLEAIVVDDSKARIWGQGDRYSLWHCLG